MGKKKKNRIKTLDPGTDLSTLFGCSSSTPDEKKNPNPDLDHGSDMKGNICEREFAELMDNALRGKNMARLLQEKKERDRPGKVPLAKRLKRYPPPESRLDLHGFTGDSAVIKTDSYIRSCFYQGIFTVKIIVGKGLHSEFGAVLPGVVQDLLAKLKDEKIVLHFTFDKKKAKSGAIIVYLNQFND